MKAVFDTTYGHHVLRDASRLIAVSRAERAQYEAAGVPSDRISVVANGIDATEYSRLPEPGTFSKRAGLEGKRQITYMGRLSPRKGIEHLLYAFAHLSATRNDLELVLVGPDGGQQVALERLARRLSIADRVLFTGLITMADKLEVLVDSDVVVYPGVYEIFGLVAFEALLCGIPVIVANDSGCGEIIADTGAGLTVNYGDVNGLAAAIVRILGDAVAAHEMVERGREFVRGRLAWSRITQEVEGVYQSVLFSRERPRDTSAT
jgi:glycosyltransferase involved in cell wall biosynthesis